MLSLSFFKFPYSNPDYFFFIRVYSALVLSLHHLSSVSVLLLNSFPSLFPLDSLSCIFFQIQLIWGREGQKVWDNSGKREAA